ADQPSISQVPEKSGFSCASTAPDRARPRHAANVHRRKLKPEARVWSCSFILIPPPLHDVSRFLVHLVRLAGDLRPVDLLGPVALVDLLEGHGYDAFLAAEHVHTVLRDGVAQALLECFRLSGKKFYNDVRHGSSPSAGSVS